ncbi:MAG TPA: hypothetical protein VEZ20_00180 [Allosphingosinicella sp.]|nr:hypothetical protein [Allosphingosinicella sp.]
MANNNIGAPEARDGNTLSDGMEALLGYCTTYSYTILVAALLFLAGGLVFVLVAASSEAAKAAADARKAAAEAELAEERAKAAKAGTFNAGEIRSIVPTEAVTALKGLAEALGNAKAWLAMVLIGLLLLWMAGTAPRICAGDKADAGEQKKDQPPTPGAGSATAANGNGNGAAGPGNGVAGNSSETTAPAAGNSATPAGPAAGNAQ